MMLAAIKSHQPVSVKTGIPTDNNHKHQSGKINVGVLMVAGASDNKIQ